MKNRSLVIIIIVVAKLSCRDLEPPSETSFGPSKAERSWPGRHDEIQPGGPSSFMTDRRLDVGVVPRPCRARAYRGKCCGSCDEAGMLVSGAGWDLSREEGRLNGACRFMNMHLFSRFAGQTRPRYTD